MTKPEVKSIKYVIVCVKCNKPSQKSDICNYFLNKDNKIELQSQTISFDTFICFISKDENELKIFISFSNGPFMTRVKSFESKFYLVTEMYDCSLEFLTPKKEGFFKECVELFVSDDWKMFEVPKL